MPRAWSSKDERQYEHIKKSAKERGAGTARAKEIAVAPSDMPDVAAHERHDMRLTHLHSRSRYPPLTIVEIKFQPLSRRRELCGMQGALLRSLSVR